MEKMMEQCRVLENLQKVPAGGYPELPRGRPIWDTRANRSSFCIVQGTVVEEKPAARASPGLACPAGERCSIFGARHKLEWGSQMRYLGDATPGEDGF